MCPIKCLLWSSLCLYSFSCLIWIKISFHASRRWFLVGDPSTHFESGDISWHKKTKPTISTPSNHIAYQLLLILLYTSWPRSEPISNEILIWILKSPWAQDYWLTLLVCYLCTGRSNTVLDNLLIPFGWGPKWLKFISYFCVEPQLQGI